MAKSAIEEEKKLQKSVQRDLKLISDEFEMMHSFLNATSKAERVTNAMTTTLVRQVLDVEECVESVIHLDNRSNWWRRLLPSCMEASAPAASLEEVGDLIRIPQGEGGSHGPEEHALQPHMPCTPKSGTGNVTTHEGWRPSRGADSRHRFAICIHCIRCLSL